MAEKYTILTTTVSSEESARRISDEAVSSRLAACAQIEGPLLSTYWWRGIKETAREWRIVFKTRLDLTGPLTAKIRTNHPYELPEIASWAIEGSPDYLDWIRRETSTGGNP